MAKILPMMLLVLLSVFYLPLVFVIYGIYLVFISRLFIVLTPYQLIFYSSESLCTFRYGIKVILVIVPVGRVLFCLFDCCFMSTVNS